MPEPSRRRYALLLGLLFAAALLPRLFGLTWDQGHNYHPDERRIVEAVRELSFSPLRLDPKFYAYGSLPFYVTRAACSLLGNVSPWFLSWDGVLLTGRVLSALWGAAGCLLLALLGRRLLGERVSLLAGALLAIAVFPVQNAHFATNDIPLATLVTATLLLLVRALERRTVVAFAVAGAVGGLALATKASAVTLLLPLLLAPLLAFLPERRLGAALAAAGAAIVAAGAAFLAGQPSALFAARELLASVSEQGLMVRNAGSVPYTNQYVGTPHGLYEVREIVLWGLGPALGLAAFAGVAARLRPLFRDRDPREVLLWAWALPFFAVTASFEVRFPRYLLPLYPLLLLAAASLLAPREREGAGRRSVRRAVLGLSGAWLLAFLSIYTRPHSIVAASEWFHANVAPGASVLVQHWDEGFPFSLPDRPSDRYRVSEVPFYDADGPEKTARLAGQLATGDVLVLQTKRLYGAIDRARERYPDTHRLFLLLFSGDLGYELVRTFSSPPSLFGFRVPTELADESFSVYDHPKAVVFRNAARLPAHELEQRLRNGVPSQSLSRARLLRAAPADPHADSGERIGGTRRSLRALALWAALLQALGLAAWRVLGSRLPAVPGTYAFAKVAGVAFFGAACWGLVSWGTARFVPPLAFGAAFGVVLLGLFPGRTPRRAPRREFVATEVVFWGTFLLFAAVRAYSPELFWGEKPMDFAILNTLMRSELLPPPEPWFSGTPLSYTYFGHFLVAAFAKALGVHPALAFNLGVASTAALTAAALLAAGAFLGGRLRTGAWAVLLGLFAGNLSGLLELWRHRSVDFDLFWALSRILRRQNEINEFPLWSFLFADLHAHVLAFPLLLGLLATLLLVCRQRTSPELPVPPFGRSVLLALAALFLATLLLTNGWSAPTAAALVALLLAVSALAATPRPEPPLPARRVGRLLAGVVVPAAAVALPAALFTLPFWRSFTPPPRNVGWERGPWFDPVSLGLVHGLALVLVVPFLFCLLAERFVPSARGRRVGLLLSSGLALLLGLSLLDLSALASGRLSPAPSIRTFVLGLGGFALTLAFGSSIPPRRRVASAVAALAFLILGACEVVFVWDRMNTVFKFGLDATLLLAVAGAAAVDELLCRRPGRLPWRAAAVVAAAAAFATSVLALTGNLRTRRVDTPRGTLDGLAYLERHRPDEAAAVAWLNENVPGLPTLAEAWGPSYQEYARFSSNTGLPNVVGWDYHVYQRGKGRADIDARVSDVKALFASGGDAAGRVLSERKVRYLVSGREERAQAGGSDPFRSLEGIVSSAFTFRDVTVYRVLLGPRLGVPVAKRAFFPAAQAPPPAGRALSEPRGVAIDGQGRIWVADFGNHRVVRYEREFRNPLAIGRRGTEPLEFDQPSAVTIGPGGRVYVADTWNGRIQVLSAEGAFLSEIRGDFFGPRGVAVDAKERVFVSDTGNHRVVRVGASGRIEKEWGRSGPERERLNDPMGIAVDSDGSLWVADNGNGRLCRYGPDGRLLGEIPVAGWRNEAGSEPQVVVSGGEIWVSVPLVGEVRLLARNGEVRARMRPSSAGARDFQVCGVALDDERSRLLAAGSDGRLYWLQRRLRGER